MKMHSIYSKASVLMTTVLATVAMTACNGQNQGGNNPIIDGIQGPNVSLINGTLTISAIFTNVIFQGGVTLPVPHTKNSYIEVGPNLASPGMLLQIGLNMDDLAFLDGNANSLPPNQLPGGRPLPGIVGGALPSIAVQVPQWDNATFYIGTAFVGVFMPLNMNAAGIMGTFLFYDSNNKQVGTISVIGADSNGKNSGILLMLNLKSVMPTYSSAKIQSPLM